MKFDTIIIGAGESGISKGMQLLCEGKRVCIVSAGRSTIAIRHAAKDIMNYDARMVEGTKMEKDSRNEFRRAGGILLEGDEVVNANMTFDGRMFMVQDITTRKLQGERLTADKYYLAAGTFVSRGLQSNYSGIYEPIFNLDVVAPQSPAEWINGDFFADQPFMHAHVTTSTEGNAMKDCHEVTNLYPIGSIAGTSK